MSAMREMQYLVRLFINGYAHPYESKSSNMKSRGWDGLVTTPVICNNAYVIDPIAEGSVILICGVCASRGHSLPPNRHRWSSSLIDGQVRDSLSRHQVICSLSLKFQEGKVDHMAAA